MRVKTNVVILCFNALPYTKATISSLFEKTDSDYLLTIVNNGSHEDTRTFLENLVLPDNCKEYTLINNPTNMGSTHANNQAFALSLDKKVPFTCFCNNDLYFSIGWLRKLEESLENNPNVAMVNPLRPSTRALYSLNTSTMEMLYQLPETSDYREELEGYTAANVSEFDNFCEKIINVNRPSLSDNLEIINFPDALSTCVCLVNNQHISKLDHFANPDFTSYGGEDIDTSWRVMQAGYDCAISKDVYVHHFRGKSLKSNGLDREALIRFSNQRLYSKWKNEISDFLLSQAAQGVAIDTRLATDTGSYWLLSQLNRDVDLLADLKREEATV